MPTTTRVGAESAANKALGGVPTVHYFDFMSRGRGQTVRLFCEDAGIAYDNLLYSMEEYPQFKETTIKKLNPTGNIPVVELNGKIYVQSYAILRHFSRLLNAYDGKTPEDKYFVDVITDIVTDWRTLFVTAFLSQNKEDYAKHQQGDRRHYLTAVERHLEENASAQTGPYITGSEFTYGDILLYQVLHDESLVQNGRQELQGYPWINKFVEATQARPNIRNFLQSDRYRG